ncbi:MAG TPA: hypothetical protein VHY91_26215 [Pirellulales bacterium]|jgi:hypothetical protein|nr:hypothetical protein [Pirellulales bacterium]
MKRPLGLVLVAILIFCAGFIVVALIDPATLVSKTVRLDDGDHEFRIRNDHGSLSASHAKPGTGLTSPSSITLIGSSQDVGTADPRIVVDKEHNRVLLYVGKGRAEYDTTAKTLDAWPGTL